MAIRKRKIGDRISGIFRDNLIAKLMALAMALALWFYAYNVSIARDRTYTLEVKVHAPEGWSIATEEPATATVEVTLDFPLRFEQDVELANRGISCFASAGPDDKDFEKISLQLDWKKHLAALRPYGIRKATFKPSQVTATIVRNDTKDLQVRLQHTEPPEGYQVSQTEKPKVVPEIVAVVERVDVLRNLKAINTLPVDISSTPAFERADVSYRGRVGLVQTVLVNGERFPIKFPSKVTYGITLERMPTERPFADIKIRLCNLQDYPHKVELQGARTRDVVVSGPESVVNELTHENILLFVDPAPYEPSEIAYPLTIMTQFNIAHGARNLRIKLELPSSVTATATEKGETIEVKISEPEPG